MAVEQAESPITIKTLMENAISDFTAKKCKYLTSFVPFLCIKGTPLSFIHHFPMIPFFKYKRPRRTVFMCGRQEGKCLSTSDLCYISAENGYPVKPLDIEKRQLLITKNPELKASYKPVLNIFDNGVRDLIRITTRRGSVMEITPNHRVYTINGYVEAAALSKDDFLMFPRKAGKFMDVSMPEERIKVTAYLIGDGHIGLNKVARFTSACPDTIEDFISCIDTTYGRGGKKRSPGTEEIRAHKSSIVHTWMEEDNLSGTYSYNKYIPKWVFDLSKDNTALFVSRLWATDGSIKRYDNKVDITYCSKSRDLIYQLQALLTKFGIISGIRKKKASYKKNNNKVDCGHAYELQVETRESLQLFMSTFDVPGKPPVELPNTVPNNNRHVIPIDVQSTIRELFSDILEKNGKSLRSRGLRGSLKYNLSYSKLKKYLELAEDNDLQSHPAYKRLSQIFYSDFAWDKVIKIENIPAAPTIDLEIEENHNYLSNGIVVHNSVSLGASSILRSRIIGNYDVLGIQPRFDQIKRFSQLYTGPMLEKSPLRGWFKDDSRDSSIMARAIKGGGTLHYAYAFLTPDATRGFAVQELNIDEIQDIQNAFIPIIEEVLSAQTVFGMRVYSGTPKTIENTLNTQYMKSSQAYVHINCEGCNFENIANKENHIYKMIGKKTCICAKCGKPLNLRKMRYIHHNPEMRNKYEGYHISQVTHPLHAWFPEKWSELVDKLDDPAYSEVTFENEVLGLPSEHNNTPLSEADLREACDPDMPNTLKNAAALCRSATMKVAGVDWSGFGADGTSTTVVVIAATFPGNDAVKILYAERLAMGADPEAEAVRIRAIFNACGCEYFAHDFSGAGTIREALIGQMGINKKKFIPFDIVHAPVRKKIISFYKPSDGGRSCYNIDKTRSLMILFQMIKKKKIVFPRWEDSKPVISDLLNIMQETHTTPRGGDYIIMDKVPGTSDDCAYAVNLACSTIWHTAGKYPQLAPQIKTGSEEDMEQIAQLIGDKEERERIKKRLKNLNIKPPLR